MDERHSWQVRRREVIASPPGLSATVEVRYQGDCLCGWLGGVRYTIAAASVEALEHRQAANRAADGEDA